MTYLYFGKPTGNTYIYFNAWFYSRKYLFQRVPIYLTKNKVRMPLGHRPPAYEIKIITELNVWISKSRLNIEYLLTGTEK